MNEMSRRGERPLAPPSPELDRLKTLLDQDKVKLGVHIRKMNSPGSPVYRMAENTIPAAVILVGSFGTTVLTHWYAGAVVLFAGCGWWLWKHMPRVKDGVFDRTAALVLTDQAHFDFWWSRGVLSLYAKLPSGEERAATRRNEWRQWVRDLPEGLETQSPGRREEEGA